MICGAGRKNCGLFSNESDEPLCKLLSFEVKQPVFSRVHRVECSRRPRFSSLKLRSVAVIAQFEICVLVSVLQLWLYSAESNSVRVCIALEELITSVFLIVFARRTVMGIVVECLYIVRSKSADIGGA